MNNDEMVFNDCSFYIVVIIVFLLTLILLELIAYKLISKKYTYIGTRSKE